MREVIPVVSIVVPCRNEKNYIEACIHSILAQESPSGGFEIIVADGISDDGTRGILEKLAKEDPRLQVIDNPGRFAACGRNAGIRKARGKYIAILDAHAEYAQDYIRTCVELLDEHPEVCCSGGPIISRGKGVFGQATAVAMSHPVGVGNARHRFPYYEGYAEGACFPMFRREVFDELGLFDESLVRTEDDEFNYRIARNGGKIFISPRARCIYYVRETPSQLFWQYCQYGYWRVAVLRKYKLPASIRQIVPVTFFSLMFALIPVGFFSSGWWRLIAIVLPLTYMLMLIAAGIEVAKKQGIIVGLLFPIAAGIMHIAYTIGFFLGVINIKSQKMFGLSR